MNTNNLICWLPFDTSVTFDYCGNTWTTSGAPSIVDNNLYLNGSSYLKLSKKFVFALQDFTIQAKIAGTSNTAGGAVCIWQLFRFNEYRIQLQVEPNGRLRLWGAHGNSSSGVIDVSTTSSILDGNMHHTECAYCNGVWYLFLDGQLIGTANYSTYSYTSFDLYIGNNYATSRKLTGYISQFIFYNNIALHTSNFTPPTTTDYATIDFETYCDTHRKIKDAYIYTPWDQPVLTANDSDNSFIVSSSGATDAYKAFDNSTSSYADKFNNNAWIQFVTEDLIEIRRITIKSTNYLPRTGIVQVSDDDGATWRTVGTWIDFDGVSNSAVITFDGDYPVGRYFRLVSQSKSFAYPNANADIRDVIIEAYTLTTATDFDLVLDFDTLRQVGQNIVRDLIIDFDTSKKVANNLTIDFDTYLKNSWRYENYGTADLLSVSGDTFVDDEAVTQNESVYKSTFCQTSRVKCFDIPATDEIWCKFDVYTRDLYIRWRAFNETANSIDGIESTPKAIAFHSSGDTNNAVYTTGNILTAGTHQTVLLHMVSGSSNGIIEAWLDGVKLYTYTGNVNNGNNFENFYLQSDGASINHVTYSTFDRYELSGTSFSNVIISNQQIELNENANIDFLAQFDTCRSVSLNLDCLQDFDTYRQVVISIDPTFDTFREVFRTLDLKCDTLRQIPHYLTITPVENGLPINTPQTNGIQSIEINISAGSLVDQLTVVTVNDIDILDAVRGQYLDYVYDYRVESFSKRGILSTCRCCSSIDNLLYTQIAYKLQKITWNGGLYTKDSDDNSESSHPAMVGDFTITSHDTEIQKKTVSASEHVRATASRLKLTPVMLFDDFQSTVDIEQEGVTYQDILSEVFDWSNRVPHKQINCYIRGNYLYVVERGHEQFTYDLDSAHVGKDFDVQKQLMRTSFGVTRKTSNLEKNAGVSKNGWWETVLGNEIPDEEPQEPEEETPTRNLPSHVQTKNGDVTTDIWYTYDSDGNILTTRTETTGGDVDTRVVVSNSYTTRNGEKLLKSEHTEEYERQDGGSFEKVNDKFVNHTYTTVGQQHVSSVDEYGSVNGSVTTSARRDDRPTAYDDAMNNRYLKGTLFEGVYYVERDGHIFVGGVNTDIAMYTYENGKKVEVVGFIFHPNEFEYETGTLEEVLLYDSSFPVNDAKAQSITNALKWLNRKIQETITLDVYDQLHVFDLNDKLIFQGNTYFLQSNTVTKTPNIVNKQSLTLVRWY